MLIGIDSFVSVVTDPATGVDVGGAERVQHLLEEVETADRVGLDTYGIGEHHRSEYMDSAPAVLLAAAAARTTQIRLSSAVTVLSAADPVRVFQEFATLDLVSRGRIDLVVGRGSFTEAFPLFGLPLEEYDALFAEKLELLLALRAQPQVTWSGRFRAPLTGQGVYPRPTTRSTRPREIRSSVANSWNTRTGSAALSTVTALCSRIREVLAAVAASSTGGAES